MKSNLIFIIACAIFGTACVSTNNTLQNSSKNQKNRKSLPDLTFAIDNNGTYEVVEIEKGKRPEPIQGQNQWIRDFYGSIKYPAKARKYGTEGIVILDVEINESGKVISVNAAQGISIECDNEAKRAFIDSTQQGYFPFIQNDKPVKFKMQIPVGFWIE